MTLKANRNSMSTETMKPPLRTPRLEVRGYSKQFGGVKANDGIDLRLDAGEIHALLGENGAGKSTFMKMLYGLLRPDSGTLLWQGEQTEIPSPIAAERLGIGMVQQHFALLENLTVTDNLALTLNRSGRYHPRTLATRIETTSQALGIPVAPERPIYTLSVGERQRVELLRCLLQDTPLKLLILDEPTAVLTPPEVATLFTVLRTLAEKGLSILFVSHKLAEIHSLCARVTVLRQGKVVALRDIDQTHCTDLAALMIGESMPQPMSRPAPARPGQEVLRVTALSQAPNHIHGIRLENISFSLHAHEILGIAGVSGNGQQELLSVLVGEHPVSADSLCLHGQPAGHQDLAARRDQGMRYVPEDRMGTGVAANLSLIDNALLTRWSEGTHYGFLSHHKARALAQSICTLLDVRHHDLDRPASTLSGGNLQKFILGREMSAHPRILIIAQPTWGVDIHAAARIHEALRTLRDQGTALLVVSDDLDELLMISDRITVITQGRLSPIYDSHAVSPTELGQWMGGHPVASTIATSHAA